MPRSLACLALLALASGALQAAPCAPWVAPAFDAQPGWKHMPLSKLKKDTGYAVEREGGSAFLRADAQGAASAYVHLSRHDPAATPILAWRWKADALVEGADNTDSKKEDAPVRVIVGFDGDKSTLPDKEKRRFSAAKKLSGRDMPYATLMYIWEPKQPVGTVIPSAHTSQLKMIVAESGTAGLGAWRDYRRNLVEDFRRAFGKDPGAIVGLAVMTDTDNTGGKAVGLYGPIRLECADGPAR